MPADRLNHTDSTDATDDAWAHVGVEFDRPDDAERLVADRIAPVLDGTEWWFVRKRPEWRIRYRPGSGTSDALGVLLDELCADGAIRTWHPGIYEPETHAFGGPAAMQVAHRLFHHDSVAILGLAVRTTVVPLLAERRRELGVLTVGLLLRSAGLDRFEQGDVWAKVAHLRDADHQDVDPRTTAAVNALLRLDGDPDGTLARRGALAGFRHGLSALRNAGGDLADLNRDGTLTRGLRAVLAHHVIFHWNRLGLSYDVQQTLAGAARGAVFDEPPP